MAINLNELKAKSAANSQSNLGNSAQQNKTMNSFANRNMNTQTTMSSVNNTTANNQINNQAQATNVDINADLLKRDQRINNVPTDNGHIGHDFVVNSNPYAKVEEKVAHLSLQVNQVIIRPYLQQALDYLKSSKIDAINAYNQLSDEIANEVKVISQNSNIISNKLKEAKNVINRTQEVIRNRYNNATEEEIANCAVNLDYEYNIVAEHYELTLQLSQELAKYKSRIDTLLASQSLLDESIIPSISRIQLEIDNLELLLHSLDSSDYASIIASKTGRNVSNLNYNQAPIVARGKNLNNLVEQTGIYNYNNLNDISNSPNLANMNRYEDPNSSLNINKTPINPNNNSNNGGYNSNLNNANSNVANNNNKAMMNNNASNNNFNKDEYIKRIEEETRKINEAQNRIGALKEMMNNPNANLQQMDQNLNSNQQNNNGGYNYYSNQQVPLTRREMRLQRKLMRQQMKLNAMNNANNQAMINNANINMPLNDDMKMQTMQQQYSDNLAQMQKIQASNINIQNDLVQMQQERQLRLQEQMQQQFANMMQQQQMQQQMVQQFYQSMQQPVLNVGMTMTNPSTMAYPVYQTVSTTPINTSSTTSRTSNLNSTTSTTTNNLNNNQQHTVIEKQMQIDTLEENLAKSPRDKIFVVRNGEPISTANTQKINEMKNLRTIKVIK